MFAMSSHTRVSTDYRLVVKVFHESISIRKLSKTKTEVASIPDDTIVLHRVLTSVGRREGEVEVGEVGEGGGRRDRKGRGGQEGGQEEEAAEREWARRLKGEGEEDKMGVKLRDRWGIQMGYLTVQ